MTRQHPGQAHGVDEPVVYRMLRGALWPGLALGVLFALYRNDVFLGLARTLGGEVVYLEQERQLLGGPAWGTPRSLKQVLMQAGAGNPESVAPPTASGTPPPDPGGAASAGEVARVRPSEKAADSPEAVSLDSLPVLKRELPPAATPERASPTPVQRRAAPIRRAEPIAKPRAKPAPTPREPQRQKSVLDRAIEKAMKKQ